MRKRTRGKWKLFINASKIFFGLNYFASLTEKQSTQIDRERESEREEERVRQREGENEIMREGIRETENDQ